MGYSVSQSLISGQPPLLVFTVCLSAFGLTMVILAYVVGEQDVPNPDVQMDWNNLFKKVSSYKLCSMQNETDGSSKKMGKAMSSAILNSSLHVVDKDKSMSAMLSDVVHPAFSKKFDYVEISAAVQFKLLGKIQPNSFFQVSGKMKGSLLGFVGKYASLVLNVSLSFLLLLNSSCSGESCSSLWEACLKINLPSELLYEAKNPATCDLQVTTPIDTRFVFEADGNTELCLELNYAPDPKLTEILSVHERSIVNLHLMHTSYFLFVMVMTLVCYSLIRGRYHYPKISHPLEKDFSNLEA